MRPPLKDGNVLLTGASSGIGREMARQLASTARSIVLVARRAPRLEELKEELLKTNPTLKVSVQPCDLQDRAAMDRMLQAAQSDVGTIDILINNAGLGDVGLFEFSSWEKVDAMIQVDVTAPTYLTHRLLDPMLKQGRGGILNVSSGYGLTWAPGLAAYTAAKYHMSALSECLRSELSGTGVVVSQLCPGPVESEFLEVAGNPTGFDVPRILLISAKRCARAGLRGFARGRAIIIPGIAAWLLINMGRQSPAWSLRAFYYFVGRYLRKRQSKAGKETVEGKPEGSGSQDSATVK